MNNKELIRCALMGDKQAQEECTAKGIVLPCPFCGNENNIISNWGMLRVWCPHCKAKSEDTLTTRDALKSWNARPAPPIGRCEDCKWYECGKEWYPYCNHPDGLANSVRATDFCCCFEPREE